VFLKKWMSYLSDGAKLNKIAMPGSHNAGSYGMTAMACCQDGTLYDQAAMGVRHFCIRLNTDRKGRIALSHGVAKGRPFAEALADMRKAMDDCPAEFFIFDIREYYPTSYGPVKLTSRADPKEVSRMIAEALAPEKYALHEFGHISDVTMGGIRRAGKRYMIINYGAAYEYSVDCEQILPWEAKLHGLETEKFIKEITKQFDNHQTQGIYWFQTQQTAGFGTELGLKTPRKMDAMQRPFYPRLIESIAANPFYLGNANVISGDFMTADDRKAKLIVGLNLNKGIVRDDCKEEFSRNILRGD